jgi:hypothetical protein
MVEIWPNVNRVMVIGDNFCVVDGFVVWKCTIFSQVLIGAKNVGWKKVVSQVGFLVVLRSRLIKFLLRWDYRYFQSMRIVDGKHLYFPSILDSYWWIGPILLLSSRASVYCKRWNPTPFVLLSIHGALLESTVAHWI